MPTQKIVNEIEKYFDSDTYRFFVFLRSYSRWLDNKNRRETWEEVVDRYMGFMKENLGSKLPDSDYQIIKDAILYQKVMPSMRLLWASGDAVRKNNSSSFNCTYTAIDDLKRFSEILFLLCSGAGVGFSVEEKAISKLPVIKKQIEPRTVWNHVIGDSREGWADALNLGMNIWYGGNDVVFDFSKIRPQGSRLKTFGGRASGPEPLKDLLLFTKNIILNAQERKLRPIEVHDIVTKIAEIVVAGGTRRSSEISLSDLNNEEMRKAKDGNFYELYRNRTMANNSAVYNSKPSQQEFVDEWLNLMKSGSGERGIFNRYGALKMMPVRRKKITKKEVGELMGVNPCSEIFLRSQQMCNLTSVVCREDDTLETLLEKVRIATILGTYQSTLTNFTYLSPEWKKNCEEERLLGVSLNGQYDSVVVRKYTTLKKLRKEAIKVNKEYAKMFGIKSSSAITCTKPEGTGSQMLNCSSGAHPRYAKYYIRRIRVARTDPILQLLNAQGVPTYPEVGQDEKNATTFVLEFPIKSPDNAITRDKISAIDQLKHWKKVKKYYAEHTVSTTVYVGKNEWIKVANWLWDNWDIVSGLSFLPKEDNEHVYKLAPYEEISEKKYNELVKTFPKIDFSELGEYEKEDQTSGARTIACGGGVCELDLSPEEMKNLMSIS